MREVRRSWISSMPAVNWVEFDDVVGMCECDESGAASGSARLRELLTSRTICASSKTIAEADRDRWKGIVYFKRGISERHPRDDSADECGLTESTRPA